MFYLKKSFISCVALFAIFFSAKPLTVFSQVYGCRDPLANNYNPSATINDGSCKYNTTSYTPGMRVDLSDTLIESSGLQMAGNFLWSHNDGGGAAAIYRIDTLSKAILQTVTLTGATNVDWEDIAFDGTYFYVGDFGNNETGARQDLKIYKFPFSAIPDYVSNPNASIPSNLIQIINYTYADQVPVVPADKPNHTKFDCEAMIVDKGNIHLFSKNWVDTITTHYVIQGTLPGSYVAIPRDTLKTGYVVTGADKAVGQDVIALIGYQFFNAAAHFMHLLSDYTGDFYFSGNKRKIDLPEAYNFGGTGMGQAEGITFKDATYGYISNEKFLQPFGSLTFTVNQRLRTFNTSSFVSYSVLPLQLKQFNVSNTQGANKISWQFDSKVNNLQVQYSTNGTNFSNIRTFSSSLSDVLYNKPSAGVNCYRLAWEKKTGEQQYSNNVCLNNEVKSSLRKVSLKSNGEFTFVLDGSDGRNYSFKLITTDGKLLSETSRRSYSPGLNSIKFSKSAGLNGSVFLVSTNNSEVQTTLLKVQ